MKEFYENIGRPDDFAALAPEDGAYYDSVIRLDLSQLEAMIALPFHPSNVYTVHELQAEPERILREAQEACNRSLKGVSLDLTACIGSDGKALMTKSANWSSESWSR